MRVRFAAVARQELVEVGDYIAIDNRSAARRYVAGLKTHCEALRHFPRRFTACPEFGSGLHRTRYRSHDIYYSVQGEIVLVERIVHAMRDTSTLSFKRRE
ncbi:type II toxin-antitoxin system RelE/ParE family toxin [Brevundimonas subvibrioides]|uniref:type II toxin-antitoxin system RelE/ParE family toxin n=1 Tax=Brevundimonas subvibrioides TaxID=74313 RepID=UPI0022B2B7B7|nr:type II toxin-antitoxin system RelE/ParE family toxin [Brevundimonas subvibrioides]